MQYFYVTCLTRDGERQYQESGVLTASTIREAEAKAKKAKALFERPGLEEFCGHDWLREISVIDYTVLKKYMLNIDRYVRE